MTTSWVYWQSEPHLWTVGYYEPNGERYPESDWESKEEAAKQVHYLNGGCNDSAAAGTDK